MPPPLLARHPVVDVKTGLITPEWLAWFQELIAPTTEVVEETVLAVPDGGTGKASWAAGDLVHASAADVLAGLPAVARGAVLASGGVSTPPLWVPGGATGTVLTSVSGGEPTFAVPAAPLAHDVLSVAHGDTVAAAILRGDLLAGNATPKLARLAKGVVNAFVVATATDVVWSSTASAVTTQTTVGAAGAASALPATPTGYLVLNLNGTEYAVPFYLKA